MKGINFSNSSDQHGCIINSVGLRGITFEQCNFLDNESTGDLIITNNQQTTLFKNCRFERNQSSVGTLSSMETLSHAILIKITHTGLCCMIQDT